MKKVKDILPGLIVAVLVGVLSMIIAMFAPKIGAATIAIFLGMIVGNVFLPHKIFLKGYKYAESDLLSYSIVLLGGTLSIRTLLGLGLNGILYIVIQMAITIIACLYYGKLLKFGNDFRYLMAGGNAVCGSSAVAATSAAIDADDKDKGIVITIVNVIGIFLMFILPLIGKLFYNNELNKTSALIGGILQSVGQVVASSSMVNEEVKDLATIYKILRVILLVAVVFLFGHLKHRSNEDIIEEEIEEVADGRVKVPWYVIGFFIMCALYSINIIPNRAAIIFKEISNKLEIIALAGIGLRVSIKELIKVGKSVSIYALLIGLTQIISGLLLIRMLL